MHKNKQAFKPRHKKHLEKRHATKQAPHLAALILYPCQESNKNIMIQSIPLKSICLEKSLKVLSIATCMNLKHC